MEMYHARASDEAHPELARTPEYPMAVTLAGLAWIAFGALILFNLVILLASVLSLSAQVQAEERGAAVAGGFCGGLMLALFGAVFIHVGIQSVRGTARDTLGNGIGSILFGLINFVSAAVQSNAGHGIQAGIGVLIGTGLVTAGVLALMGRTDYKAWRQADVRTRQ